MPAAVDFDVWGSRGSRNLLPGRSRIGTRTSCYSLLSGKDLLVLDAGSGLLALGDAMRRQARLGRARTVHVLVSHAHMDHWEGLKDVDWFWRKENGVDVTIGGSAEAIETIRSGFAPPAYVPLERLAHGTAAALRFVPRLPKEQWTAGPFRIEAFALNHYSGFGESRRTLLTLGYRIRVEGGPSLCYLSDHEPVAETADLESKASDGTDLLVLDAHFTDRQDHAFGHGSQEYAAGVARAHPKAVVLAAHLGPTLGDAELREACRRHGRGLPGFRLAVEGRTFRWDARRRRFAPRSGRRA